MCIWSLYKESLSRNNKFHSFDYRIHLKILSAKGVNALSAPCIAVIHEINSHFNFWRLLYRCRHFLPLPYPDLCDKAECNCSTFIDYTTCSLYEKFKMLTQIGSINKHLKEKHKKSKVPRRDLLDNKTVLTHDGDNQK